MKIKGATGAEAMLRLLSSMTISTPLPGSIPRLCLFAAGGPVSRLGA